MGFSRQEYWSGLPFPSPGDLPNPGLEPGSPALYTDALPSEPPGKSLNVNGLNAPTKKQRLAEWIQKQDPCICCLQENHFKTRDTYRLKVKGWKKIFHVNGDQKKAGLAILISDKIDFEIKATKRDKEGHYIMIKGSIQDITIMHPT